MAFAKRSKFFNVASTINKSISYPDARPSTAEHSQLIAASGHHLVVGWTTRNGASLGVRPIESHGRGGWSIVHPQSATITDIQFHPYHDNILATSAEDGALLLSKIPLEVGDGDALDKVCSVNHDRSISVVRFHPSAENVVGTAGHDNCVKIWDIEGHKAGATVDLDAAVDDLAWNFNGSSAICTDKNKNLHVLDARAGSSVAKIEAHQGTKPIKCFWAGEHNVATTGFTKMRERELRVWDSRSLSKSLGSTSFGSAPGVLVPHFDADAKLVYLAGRGEGMVHTIDMSPARAPFHTALMTGKIQDKDSQLSVCLLPKRALNVMDCEVGRVFRLLKSSVQVVHMNVSRPNKDLFYPELFPETRTATSQSAGEFFSGGNKDAIMASLEPK